MKKKIAIIGGGISGCVIANYLASKGNKVSLYEKSNHLGGILKDQSFNKKTFLKLIDCLTSL